MANPSVQIQISATDQASSVIERMQQRFGELNRETERVSRKFTELNSAFSSLGAALSLGAVAALTKSFLDAGLQVERLNKLFSAAAGSASLGGREMEYVKQVSDKMGLSVLTTAESYGKFMAAIRGTTLEGEAGRKVFESVSGASSALGLSAEETSGVFNALQQMMSKGKVQAEELRGQLGERLPGAFKMAADAMGVTTAELDKMLKDGKVLAADLLPRLAEQLDKTYGKAATEGAKSAAAELNRLNNAMFETRSAAGAALIPVFTDIVKALKPAVELIGKFIAGIQILAVQAAANHDKRMSALKIMASGKGLFSKEGLAEQAKNAAGYDAAANEVIDEIMKRFTLTGSDYTAADVARQKSNKPMVLTDDKKHKGLTDAQKEAQQQVKQFLKDVWDTAAMELAAEDFGSDVVKKMGLFNGKALTGKKEKLGIGFSPLLSLEQQDDIAREAEARRREEMKVTEELAKQMIKNIAEAEAAGFRNSPWAGLAEGVRQYADEVGNLGRQFEGLAVNTMRGMEQALTNFVMTGKLNFKDLANSIIQDIIRIQMRAMVSGLFSMAMGAIGSSQWGSLNQDASYLNSGGLLSGQRASGGPVAGGQSYLVGERGPEIFTPGASGMITPNSALGGSPPVTINVINQTGQQMKAKDGGMKLDASGMIKTIVLEAMDTDPGFRWAMRGA